MTASLAITIPGRPYTKNQAGLHKDARYRAAIAWEKKAKEHAEGQLMARGIDTPVFAKGVPVTFVMNVFMVEKKKRGDLQNYFKSACDAMNGILYHDDAQIVRCEGLLILVPHEDLQKLTIVISEGPR